MEQELSGVVLALHSQGPRFDPHHHKINILEQGVIVLIV